MTETLRCLNGHHWEIGGSSDTNADPTRLVCPVCGNPPDQDSLVDPTLTTVKPWSAGAFSGESKQGSDAPHETTEDYPPIAEKSGPVPSTQGREPGVTEQPTLIGEPPFEHSTESTGSLFSDYQLLGVLGRGGMGIVYKARHKPLDRMVALKMLHPQATPPKTLARFQAEAKAIAHLTHPNIVQIHEIGQFEGKPFLSLEFVEGGSLSNQLRKTTYSPRQAAQLVETIARAVHHAHQQGILHRDLKPGNILLAADGTPKITDFGLAKRIETLEKDTEKSRLTNTGEILGTPSYMAPEQASGLSHAISPATDVYALGAILYELLTHHPPFEGATPMQTILQVMEKEPTLPQKIEPGIPRDLQTICMTCLHKEPSLRYETAEALADDLRAYLVGEAIKARPVTRLDQYLIWLRRRPMVALGIGVALTAFLGLIVGALWYHAFAVVAVAIVSLVIAAWWYGVHLRRTLRHLDEEHLEAERNVERLNLLLETTQDLMKANNLDEILLLLSETTTRMVNAERATIYLVDEEKQELWSKVALGEGVGEIRIKMNEGIAGTVAGTGEIISIADPYNDKRFNPEIDRRTGYRTRNLLTFPMRASDQRILGVFQVLNKRKSTFVTEDVQILQPLASSAAIAVEKATE